MFLEVVVGVFALQWSASAALADGPHYHIEDSQLQSTSTGMYRLSLRKYSSPPGEDPQPAEFVTYNYEVVATGDSGVWEHYIILDYFPSGGQQVPGFLAVRQVYNTSDGEWYDEADVTATWVPN